jgi:hypothetical protein
MCKLIIPEFALSEGLRKWATKTDDLLDKGPTGVVVCCKERLFGDGLRGMRVGWGGGER